MHRVSHLGGAVPLKEDHMFGNSAPVGNLLAEVCTLCCDDSIFTPGDLPGYLHPQGLPDHQFEGEALSYGGITQILMYLPEAS